MGLSVFKRSGKFHSLMSGKGITAILGKGWGFPGIGSCPLLTFMFMVSVDVSYSLLMCYNV